MSLVGHIWLGALWSKIFGLSHENLRIYIQIIHFLLSIITFGILNRVSKNKLLNIVLTIVFTFSTPLQNISFTFMTDIPFLLFFLLSVYFFITYLQERKKSNYYIFLFTLVYSVLIREVSMAFGLSATLVLLIERIKNDSKTNWFLILLPLFATISTFMLFKFWVEYYHGLPKNLEFSRNVLFEKLTNPTLFARAYLKNSVLFLCYIGIILLPLINFNMFKRNLIAFLIGVLSMIIIMLNTSLQFSFTFIFMGNLLFVDNLNNKFNDPTYLHSINLIITPIVTGMSLFSLTHLFFKFKDSKIKNLNFKAVELLALLFTVFYIFPILSQNVFTRYYLPFLPFLLILINRFYSNYKPTTFSLILIITYIYIGFAFNLDTFNYSRLNDKIANFGINDLKIDSTKLDAGFEFSAHRFYNSSYKKRDTLNWWFIQDDKYLIHWTKPNNYKVLQDFYFKRFMPPFYNQHVYLMERID
jgi:hypothetical protein